MADQDHGPRSGRSDDGAERLSEAVDGEFAILRGLGATKAGQVPEHQAIAFGHRVAIGGADGLDFYRRLANEAAAFLKPDGKIMLEFGDGQADAIKKIFEGEKWIVEAIKEDYSHRARILVARI